MTETKELTTQAATASAKEIERIATIGGNKWLAVTHYGALSALATAMVRAGIAPKGMAPEQALGVMAFGLEMGLGPIASLKSIAFINGKACMYADALRALLLASGKLQDQPIETVEGEDDARVASCTIYRVGMKTPTTKTFSVKDAKTAQLWGKPGPWTQYPDRMLEWRAFGWAVRAGFADVLNGLWTREEAEDIPVVDAGPVEARTVTPGPIPAAAPPPGVVRRATQPAPAPAAHEAAPVGNGLTAHQQQLKDEIDYLARGNPARVSELLSQYGGFKGEKGEWVPPKSIAGMSPKWVHATLRKVDPDYNKAKREEEDRAREDAECPPAPAESEGLAVADETPF